VRNQFSLSSHSLCICNRRGEGSVLSELSNLSGAAALIKCNQIQYDDLGSSYQCHTAAAAEHLHLEILMEGESLEKLQRDRTYLRYLAVRTLCFCLPCHFKFICFPLQVLLIKYSLGMSSDDCGGLSEYSHFFSTMRQVYCPAYTLDLTVSDSRAICNSYAQGFAHS